MIFKNHQDFYGTMGSELIRSDCLITHEEHYQHIKARIAKETAEDVLQAVSELLGVGINAEPSEPSQE